MEGGGRGKDEGERVINSPRTQLNDALMESYAPRGIFPRESLRTNGSGKSRGEKRREASKLGRVGDQRVVVVLKWKRKHDGVPHSKGVP